MTTLWPKNETQTHITLQKQVVVKPFGAAIATTAACICGVSLIKEQAGSNPAMRSWACGGFAFPRLCQRPQSSDVHQAVRRLPVRVVVAGAYHSESGSSIKAIAKPMTIEAKNVDDNWCSVVYNALSPRNSDGDDRAASPGWGEPAPSKPLIWRLGAQTTDHFCDPLLNRDISNGQLRRYLLEHVSALAQIAKPRTGITSYREGLSLHLNNKLKEVSLKYKPS